MQKVRNANDLMSVLTETIDGLRTKTQKIEEAKLLVKTADSVISLARLGIQYRKLQMSEAKSGKTTLAPMNNIPLLGNSNDRR